MFCVEGSLAKTKIDGVAGSLIFSEKSSPEKTQKVRPYYHAEYFCNQKSSYTKISV